MPMPSNVPAWNTGGTNRTEPLAGEKVLGWVAGDPVNSSYLNWLLFTIYQWIVFLQGIQSESLTWTVLQNFDAAIDVSVAAGDAIDAQAGTGTGAAGIRAIGGSGSASAGGYFQSLTSPSGIGAVGEGSLYGLAGVGTLVGIAGTGDTEAGVQGLSTTGWGGYFTSTAGRGLYAQSGTNFDAIQSLAQGTGYGIQATGGALGAGGRFVSPIGGTLIAGAVSAGAIGTGGAGQSGLIGVGGAGGYGVDAGATGMPSLRATRTDSASLPVFDARGSISFDNAVQPAGNLPVKNQLTRDGFAKVRAMYVCNNTVNPTIESRLNVTSITQEIAGGGNGRVTITFAQPFSTNVYSCRVTCENTGAYLAEVLTKNAGSVVFQIKDSPTNSIQTASAQNASRFIVEITGAQ